MRLLVVNPNTTVAMTVAIEAEARRRARPGTEIEAVTAPWGTPSVESHVEEALAAAATIEAVAARIGSFDGVVIACFGDPGLEAVREISPAPVVGIAEAAMAMALTLGHRFSIVAALDRAHPLMFDVVRRHGLATRCASVRTTGLSVLELERDPQGAEDAIVAAAQRAVETDGAEAICLGCAGMAGLDDRVAARVGAPTIDGVGAAVKLLEGIIDYGLKTSRVAAFRAPERKPLTGPPALVAALSK